MIRPAILLWSTLISAAADWPMFRGPNGIGIASDKHTPIEFSPNKNVTWKTALPPGHSSPIVTGDRIFLTAHEGDSLLTICLERSTGKILWRQEAPRPRKETMQQTNSPASPTPASDGRSVYVFFGDFGLVSYGFDGNERWRVPLGPFNNANGHGSSPIVADGLVVLICDQDTGSYLIAVDKDTGKVRWRVERPEVTRGYATPVVFRPKNGPAELLISAAYQFASYALATGEKLWWVDGMSWQTKSVPLIDGDIIYVNAWEIGGDVESPPSVETFDELLGKYDSNKDGRIVVDEAPENLKRWYRENDLDRDGAISARDWSFWRLHRTALNSVSAIRTGGRGDLNKNVVWRYRKSLPNVPSPLLYEGVLYLVKDGGIATTLNPKTGEVYKQARLEGALDRYWSSPVAAGGKVYMISELGRVSVLKAAAQWEMLARNELDDTVFATPAIVDNRLYIRTRSALYCFGE